MFVSRAKPQASSQQLAEKCASCSSDLLPDNAIHLWDGRWYCRRCVQRHSKDLARYAETHSCLTDRVALSNRLAPWRFLTVLCSLPLILLILVLLFARESAPAILVLIIVLVPLLAAAYVIVNGLVLPQSLKITEGIVEWKTPIITHRFEFSDCHWDLDSSVSDPWFLTTPAIMLTVRSGWGFPYRAFACTDDNSRRLWTEFLTFAARAGTAAVSGIHTGSPHAVSDD